MRIAQATRVGIWLLIFLNILMAFGSIWIFMRMSPAIKDIIEKNGYSLHECQNMLLSLIMINNDNSDNNKVLSKNFAQALERAKKHITEEKEAETIELISSTFESAFQGDLKAKTKTVNGIMLLEKINRDAMIKADLKARQFGQAGAWGIVFMAASIFFSGMLFKRNLLINVLRPIEEIYSVITAYRNGDNMRRCSGADLPADFASIFHGINEILDQCQSEFSVKYKV